MPYPGLDLIRCLGFMLDQQRLGFLSTIDDLPDDDADVAAFLARVRLDRLAPAFDTYSQPELPSSSRTT